MKGKVLLLALSAMSLATSCSNDEVTEVSDSNVIKFNVTAGAVTRTAATTTNSISEFQVVAFTSGGTEYMNGSVNRTGTGWQYNGGTKFWPESGLNIYSISPVSEAAKASVSATSQTIADYVVNGDIDLLYATNAGATKADNPVQVNFRHALSAVKFMVRNTNTDNLVVNVNGVKVVGVDSKSSFTWASETTAPQIKNPAANTTDTETDNTWGSWISNAAAAKTFASYTATAEALADVGATAVDLTTNDNLIFLLPQTLDTWTLTEKADKSGYNTSGNARLLINCQLKDKISGVQLWPTTANGYAEVAIPLSGEVFTAATATAPAVTGWKQGKKYIYTLVFGEGGGYTPDPDDPDPVLVPIKFTVTVDDFIDMTGTPENVDMK